MKSIDNKIIKGNTRELKALHNAFKKKQNTIITISLLMLLVVI